MTSCKSCREENSLIQDYDEGLVCSKCGTVSHAGAIIWETGDEATLGSGRYTLTEYEIKNSITKSSGIRDSDQYNRGNNGNCSNGWIAKNGLKRYILDYQMILCEILKLPEYLRQSSQRLLSDVYNTQVFISLPFKGKIALAGICIYVRMRQENLSITMGYMCKVTGCEKQEFSALFMTFKEYIKIEIPPFSFDDHIETFSQSWDLDKCTKRYMVELNPLLQDAHVGMTTAPETYMVPLAYLSYMTNQVKTGQVKTGQKLTLVKFCEEKKIKLARNHKVAYNKCLTVLTIMCKHLPWVDDSSMPEGKSHKATKFPNVCFYIDDLINHHNSILYELVKQKLPPITSELSSDNPVSVKRKADVEESLVNWFESCKKKKKAFPIESNEPILHDIHSETLSEHDLTLQEEKDYIRDAVGIQKFIELKELLESDNDDSDDKSEAVIKEENSEIKEEDYDINLEISELGDNSTISQNVSVRLLEDQYSEITGNGLESVQCGSIEDDLESLPAETVEGNPRLLNRVTVENDQKLLNPDAVDEDPKLLNLETDSVTIDLDINIETPEIGESSEIGDDSAIGHAEVLEDQYSEISEDGLKSVQSGSVENDLESLPAETVEGNPKLLNPETVYLETSHSVTEQDDLKSLHPESMEDGSNSHQSEPNLNHMKSLHSSTIEGDSTSLQSEFVSF